MSFCQNRVEKGHPAYFFLGMLPFLLVSALSLIVSYLSIFAVTLWLTLTQEHNSYFLILSQVRDIVTEYTAVITLLYQIPALLCIFLWYWFAYAKKKKLYQNPCTFTLKRSVPLIALLALGSSQFINLVLLLEGAVFPDAMTSYEQLMESAGIGGSGLAVFASTVLLAPVLEELAFRGLTVQILKRTGWHFWVVNLLQAALFGVFHMNLIQGIYAFLLGLLLGWVCETCGSLRASMLLHACFNICGSYLQNLLDQWLQNTKTLLPNLVLAAAGGALMVLAVWQIRKEAADKRPASVASPSRENAPQKNAPQENQPG